MQTCILKAQLNSTDCLNLVRYWFVQSLKFAFEKQTNIKTRSTWPGEIIEELYISRNILLLVWTRANLSFRAGGENACH